MIPNNQYFFYSSKSGPAYNNIQASGGVESYYMVGSQKWKCHIFQDVNSISTGFAVFANPGNIEARRLVCGAGSSGGFGNGGGGAGGGGVIEENDWVPAVGVNLITIGIGGLATASGDIAIKGTNTTFGNLIAYAGGRGNVAGSEETIDKNGGSGGGSARLQSVGLGTPGQGYNGSLSYLTGIFTTGSGGGAGGSGTSSTTQNGIGGPGILSDISGTNEYYGAGGGGGQTDGAGGIGLGGVGGGGQGGQTGISDATSGSSWGAGGGGGVTGAAFGDLGGNGYQGRAVVAYPWSGAEIDYGFVVETLTTDTGTAGRDSSNPTMLNSTTALIVGGYNPGGGSNVQSDAYITTDFITLTPINNATTKGNHNFFSVRNNGKIWNFGNADINGDIFVDEFDPTNNTWSNISQVNIGHYCLWGFAIGETMYMAVRNTGIPSQIDIMKSTDGTTWTLDSVFPQAYCENADTYVDGNKVVVGGGCYVNPVGNATSNFNTKVWEKEYPSGSWAEKGQITTEMQGAWPVIRKSGNIIFYLSGFQNSDPSLQGRLYFCFENEMIWAYTYINSLQGNHAITALIKNSEFYMGFGSDLNESKFYKVKRNN